MSSVRSATDLSFISPNLRSHNVVEKAFHGSTTDQLNLGTYFLEGANGFRKSNERGAYWLTQAVNGGEVLALNHLGACYLDGKGVIKDEKLAFQLIKMGADQGDVEAMVNAALLSANGRGTSTDHKLAAQFLQEAVSKGYGPASYQLGLLQLNGWGVPKDGDAAFQSFTSAADEGVVEAHSGLAQCYASGMGTPVDLDRAKHHWMTASYGGDIVALRSVGEKLLDGSDKFPVDHQEACRYLERAAIAGDAPAQYKLAMCYSNGIGNQDIVARDMWLEKAIAQGYPEAIAEKEHILNEFKLDGNVEMHEGTESSGNVLSMSDDGSANARGKWRALAKRIFRRATVPSGSASR